MKNTTKELFSDYQKRYYFIDQMKVQIETAVHTMLSCFQRGGKLLICGNGGSNADADHIVGELVKGFRKKRPLSKDEKKKFEGFGKDGISLAEQLQDSLPAINLGAHASLLTAVVNDIGGEEIFAQQIVGYGKEEDILLGISTSGNSRNIIKAGMVAKTKKLTTIGLTGCSGGKMKDYFDLAITAPSEVTCEIQDMHSTIYHVICAMVESELWDE